MIRLAAASALLLAAGAQDDPPVQDFRETTVAIVQMTVHQVIIRIPRGDDRVPASANSMHWRETRGPRCIPVRAIAGAMPSASSVDLLLHGNRRVRARLGQGCAALDYYRGVYIGANPDGQICAGRDAIRSRMGGQCEIVQFRLLQPARP